ncbi:MAG: 1-acyl-sn-glycerol-3-phosphate acyltransferase [Chitinophagaceae bacterium]
MGPALACYFRKSWYLGKDRLPASGPVVVISNHAASFLDAMLMGVMLNRPIHFFARGDIFRNKWARNIFRRLHMVPLFSADLAKDQLHRNADSFSRGEEVLKENGLLLIFPEGLSRMERNMLPFRKGTSRIILQTLASAPNITVQVVPIGIHYRKHEVLSDVQLTTGKVIAVGKQYREMYAAQASRTVNELTRELEMAMREVVLYVEQDQRSAIVEKQLELFDNNCGGRFSYEDFNAQKRLCERVSSLDDDSASKLASDQQAYFGLLSQYTLNDEVMVQRMNPAVTVLLLLIGLPLFIIGLINLPPYLFGKYMADTKVSRQDFYTSVISAVSAFSYVIWLALWWMMALLSGNVLLIGLVVLMPMLGWLALGWWQRFKQWKIHRNLKKTPEGIKARLLIMRDALLANSY